ncbi:uncharacterized protein LOC135576379 isoform X1 [Columba livia]|uniref:uncharacterized protein LOC135576379 isoform X1 n=1 Tax=Columba livia TaxID=8932 RepID=UPI0031BA0310
MSTRTPKSFSAELLSSGSTLKLYWYWTPVCPRRYSMPLTCLLALVVSTPISPGFPPAAAVGCVLCGPLLPPALSTDPSYHFCYEGEHLTFLCMAKTMRKIGRFWFFNQTGEQIDLRSLYPLLTARLQLTATKVSAGECSYMYFMEDSGQEIPSKRSFPLTVEVQAAPVAPTFSLDPQQQVYRNRNSIKLLWSIPMSLDYVREVPNYTDFGLAVSIPVSNLKNCNYDLRLTGDNSRALTVVPILCTNLLVPLAQREATCVDKHRHVTRRAGGHECNCKEQVLF